MALLKRAWPALLWCALGFAVFVDYGRGGETASEYQIKAVFVFNFSHFVEWPPQIFSTPTQPFVIGILGSDPFGPRIDEAVRGELINQHPLVIHRFHSVADIGDCQILYIDRSEGARLKEILAALGRRGTLTVADMDDAAQRGVMMQFVTENNRIRLRINVDAAKAAGVIISSKLLRPAEIIGTAARD
jgi:hypothetical protein